MEIHVAFGGGGAHQRHVVKGREQDAAVEGVQMQKAFQLKIGGGGGLGAVAGRTAGGVRAAR